MGSAHLILSRGRRSPNGLSLPPESAPTEQKSDSRIWQMINWYSRGWVKTKQLLASIGFVIMFYICGFGIVGSPVMVISMLLHELGHAYFFVKYHIKIVILFLFPLGAVAAPANPEENKRSDQIHWGRLGKLLLGGPAVNVALMFAGTIVRDLTQVTMINEISNPTISWLIALLNETGKQMIWVNGLLALMNLIPVWNLDAGQLFKLIYASMNEFYDRFVSAVFTAVSFGLIYGILFSATGGVEGINGLLIGLITRFGEIGLIVTFFLLAWYKQSTDKPEHAASPLRMTNWEIASSLVVFFFLFGATIVML